MLSRESDVTVEKLQKDEFIAKAEDAVEINVKTLQPKTLFKGNKIHILVSAHSFIEKSGVDVFTENLFNNLSLIDDRIEYIFVVNRKSKDYFKSMARNINIVYPSKMIDSPIGKILWYAFYARAFIKNNNIDLIYNNSATGNFIITKRVPIISCMHDLAEFHLNNKYSPWRMFYRKYVCLQINKILSKHFISISNNTKNDMIKYLKIDPDKITVIPLGADHLVKSNYDDNTVNNDNESRYLLYVGRLDPFGKNVLKLIEGFKIIADKYIDLKLFLVGNTCRGSELINNKIEELLLTDRIKLLGYVKDSTLSGLYEKAHIFVFPSLYEGFGLPILEAMKFGTPVVCSNTSSLPEVGGDAAIYFDPRSAVSIAEKIELVMDNDALRNDLESKGRLRYQMYTWENCAIKTRSILEKHLSMSTLVERDH